MGEARKRRLAREAGQPWPQDVPRPRPVPWYARDPSPSVPRSPEQERFAQLPPPRVSASSSEAVLELVESLGTRVRVVDAESPTARRIGELAARQGAEVVVVGNEAPAPTRPRRSPTEIAMLIAALSMGGIDVVPRGGR